eukprot:TRINITY_DN12432_c0_g1_i1.p1 TRINITY_DN12432_c0_g1~~TRINITY_DN12432_c0_g1_i1.p1  ORF type:complete len:107 (-),score=20.01 TRINITY_DN12432_c0_g1_i1:109-429(-)
MNLIIPLQKLKIKQLELRNRPPPNKKWNEFKIWMQNFFSSSHQLFFNFFARINRRNVGKATEQKRAKKSGGNLFSKLKKAVIKMSLENKNYGHDNNGIGENREIPS